MFSVLTFASTIANRGVAFSSSSVDSPVVRHVAWQGHLWNERGVDDR
jgi:hypothetical protein